MVVRELRRYKVVVDALQEIKWLVYHVWESVALMEGHPVTVQAPGEPGQRREGVAIVLSGPAIRAWKTAGEQWMLWSSEYVLADWERKIDSLLPSCYVPIRASSREARDEFFLDLEQALAAMPHDEPFIFLEDLNACVGSQMMQTIIIWSSI